MKKRFFLIVIVVLWLSLITVVASAHSGRTDSNGGHYDHSTGEYHYHHGYPAHQHYDIDGDGKIDCPYNFKDKTSSNNSNNTNTPQIDVPVEQTKELTFGDVMLVILKIVGISAIVLVFGWIFWALLRDWLLVPALLWICNKLIESDVEEDKVVRASYVIIVVLILAFTSIAVLIADGIL